MIGVCIEESSRLILVRLLLQYSVLSSYVCMHEGVCACVCMRVSVWCVLFCFIDSDDLESWSQKKNGKVGGFEGY